MSKRRIAVAGRWLAAVFLAVLVAGGCSEAISPAPPIVITPEIQAELFRLAGERDYGGGDAVVVGKSRRIYLIGRSHVYVFNEDRELLWRHPITYLVPDVFEDDAGEIVFAEIGKGGGGNLWRLSKAGEVLMRVEEHIVIQGMDNAGTIFLYSGGQHDERQYSRLYSRAGAVLWEKEGIVAIPRKDDRGIFVIPGSSADGPQSKGRPARKRRWQVARRAGGGGDNKKGVASPGAGNNQCCAGRYGGEMRWKTMC